MWISAINKCILNQFLFDLKLLLAGFIDLIQLLHDDWTILAVAVQTSLLKRGWSLV